MMHLIFFSFQCFVIGFIYSEILIADGHLLHPLWKVIEKKFTKTILIELPDNTPEEIKAMPGYEPRILTKVEQHKSDVLKVMGGCVYCTSGQLALWAFNAKALLLPPLSYALAQTLSEAWRLAFCICLTIFFVHLSKKLFDRWTAH